jgi:hypothetical protein
MYEVGFGDTIAGGRKNKIEIWGFWRFAFFELWFRLSLQALHFVTGLSVLSGSH